MSRLSLTVLLACILALGATACESQDQKKTAITKHPVTVTVQLDEKQVAQVSDALENYPRSSVRLSVKGVVPSQDTDRISGIKVFLNKSDATAETSSKDPHFVAAFSFAPTQERKPQGFTLDLTQAMLALKEKHSLDLDKQLNITLAAIPSGSGPIPDTLSIPVKEVTVGTTKIDR